MARARAGAASPKAANTKAARPAVGRQDEEASLELEQASRGTTGTEVLEAEEDEAADDLEADDAGEREEAEAEGEVVEEEEAEEADEPARRRRKRERGVVSVSPDEFALARTSKSALPGNPIVRYVLSSYRELMLVTWPTWQDTRNWSIVVVLVAGGIGALLGTVDFGLAKFVTWWLSLATKK